MKLTVKNAAWYDEKIYQLIFPPLQKALKLEGVRDSIILDFVGLPDGARKTWGGGTDPTRYGWFFHHYYKVGINEGLGISQAIWAFCHEMVHIQQLVEGRLRFDGDNIHWTDGAGKARNFPRKEKREDDGSLRFGAGASSDEEYRKLPWEIEAYKRGPQLYEIAKLIALQAVMEKKKETAKQK